MDPLWSNIFRKKPEEESLAYFLSTIPMFADLSPRELRFLERIVHQRHFDAEEMVFAEGDPGTGLYVIRTGKIRIYSHNNLGRSEQLALLSVGDFFGESTLTNPANRSASARTLEQSELIGLFRADLLEITQKYPGMANKILIGLTRLLGERLQAVGNQLQAQREQISRLVTREPRRNA